MSAALGKTVAFNPYADNLRFLLAAYIFEDVLPTAWEVRRSFWSYAAQVVVFHIETLQC